MKTIEVTLFSYDELSETAQANARDTWRNQREPSPGMEEEIREHFQYTLSELGYTEQCGRRDACGLNALYSLGYSQGDGVAFQGDFIKSVDKVAKRVLSKKDYALLNYTHLSGQLEGLKLFDYCDVSVKNSGRYTHWNSFHTSLDLGSLENFFNLTTRQFGAIDALVTNIQEELVALSHQLEKEGYEIIEYQNSDEAVTETIQANVSDNSFLEDGTLA